MKQVGQASLEVGVRKGRLVLFLFMALALIIVSLLLVAAGGVGTRHPAWLMAGVGIVGTALFGAFGVFLLARLFSRRPGLVIDQEGVIDNTSYSAVGRVPWSQIKGVQVMSLPTYRRSLIIRIPPPRIIVIEVRDPERFLARGNWLHRLLRRGSVGVLGSPVAVAGSVLHADLDDLARRIAAGVAPP